MFFFCLTSTIAETAAPGAPSPDEGLLAEIAQGSEEALRALYVETSAAVYGFALSILKNPHDAEDVMQETYIRLYGAASAYRPQGKPMAWILAIVRNLARMRLREAGKTVLPDSQEQWPEDTALFHSGSDDRLVLEAAMRLLSDEERQVVMLHAVSGLRHREIATLLEQPLSTVLSRYHRALAKLRRELSGLPARSGPAAK
ncbi:MAG TPA: RNA polymerase sigma factor [Firmicutes bacterium]|nr:RNA polymerase sigma factor [Bacillota bacterium]